MKKTLAALLIALFIASFNCIVFAQPLEEEEEPVQARPNPIESTTINKQGMHSVQGQKSLQTRQVQSGQNKALKPAEGIHSPAAGKAMKNNIADPAGKAGDALQGQGIQ